MAITLDGTNGITTPDVDTDGLTTDSLTVVGGDIQAGVIKTGSTGATLVMTSGTAFNTGGASIVARGSTVGFNDSGVEFYAGGSERMRINSLGNLGIGTIPSSSRVIIHRNAPTSYNNSQLELAGATGNILLGFHAENSSAVNIRHIRGVNTIDFVDGGVTTHIPIAASAFNVQSDYRIKENITPLTGAADRLMQLPVHRFSFVAGSMSYQGGITVDGFLAHEAQAVVPEAVTGDKDAVDADGNPVYQGIDQSKLVPLLTAALQEALQTIQALEARVAALETPA